MISLLPMRKLRHKEVKLAKGHTAGKEVMELEVHPKLWSLFLNLQAKGDQGIHRAGRGRLS